MTAVRGMRTSNWRAAITIRIGCWKHWIRLNKRVTSLNAMPRCIFLLADIYLKMDMRKEALVEMAAFTRADPTSPTLWHALLG